MITTNMFKLIAVVLFLQLLQTECFNEGDYCMFEHPGTCKLLSQCPKLVSEIKKAGSPMPIHIRKKLEALTCGFKDKEPIVCCSINIVSNFGETNFTNPSSSPNLVGKPDASINFVAAEDNLEDFTRRTLLKNNTDSQDLQNHHNLRLLPRDCGIIETDKIVGGENTKLFEMPWMVLLSYHSDQDSSPRFGCGGTLITERYVLTAAHCVKNLRNFLILDGVILGEYDTRTNPDCTNEGAQLCAPRVRNVSIEEITAHTDYSSLTLQDDIALIRLAEPADFNLDSMKPICLPVTQKLQTESLVGRIGTVAGWGRFEEGHHSPVLRSVDVPIIKAKLPNTYKAKGFPIDIEKQILAGGIKGEDSCVGDSGGPLLYPGSLWSTGAHYIQRGIISFGLRRCGTEGVPAVHTNVAYYMNWILDNIRS